MKKYLWILVVMSVFLATNVLAGEEDDVLGKWLTEKGTSQVEIFKNGTKFNGKIVLLKEPVYGKEDSMAGKTKVDRRNPDLSKRNDPLLGKEMIKDFVYDKGAKKWINGKIYNPEDGNIYNCYLAFEKDGRLIVRGSIDAWGLIGKTQFWEKVKEENGSEK
ncbi:MAG: DUF2147 domain-containing protein [Candidatus Margulisiibacteriota bacterium]|nr:MAG: hypothetical protein A2X43_00880 [Candidatus Margulisbacteria bacterium GWD2_39_127]OGI02385.1 MAG: hypothetical protein A2X42_09530 [Candidatus Margulisbacteria bacterium GWF2_38_17]OGI08518.1 MAG: hypothetical protein A2X41_07320 [Candidatus Margulisbacteria bacterium GWE2_39_32]PZM77202.1 MAG: DUF2147 domain-containing protein [Candidatus Margulisiibacteriota bacterium]HAR63427.1 DUF2147 domain-containing protein [Candidatus Margulisiibacteriota bacterium]